MSTGAFVNSKYSTNDANIVPIKLQPETLTLTVGGVANAAPAGAVEAGWPSADVSRSKRAIGIHCRSISVKVTDPAEGYEENGVIRVPIMTPTVWNGVAKGQAVVGAFGTGEVAGKQPEIIV